MNNLSELRSLAHKCRRLADAISDGPARDNLLAMAAEYEQRSVKSPGEKPLMNWEAQR